MFHLTRPGADDFERALAWGADAPLSYDLVGATSGELPPGWDHDVDGRVVGRGGAAWVAAVRAVRTWRPFALPWVHLHRDDVPIRQGELVAFASFQYGLWAANLCRIVEVFDEQNQARARFGFAYGTLEGHVVAGEERFLATWDAASDEVSFEIRKFSRPNSWLVRASGPLARGVQRRFTEEAIAAVGRAVAGP